MFSSINTDLISWVFTMDCRQKTNRLEAAIKDAFCQITPSVADPNNIHRTHPSGPAWGMCDDSK